MPNSPFASFRGTYQPLPISTFDETNRVLQDQYYKNREAEDKLISSLNNLNVDDLDKEVLYRTVGDVNSELSSINGEYEKAGNVIRTVVKKLDTNDELKAAVQDKANYDATLKSLQEKSLDPKSGVTQEAIQAFAVLSKKSKKGAIYKDQYGTIQNRMSISPPPLKPDVDKEVFEIIKELRAKPNKGESNLHSDAASAFFGYAKTDTVSQMSEEQLRDAVTAFINTKPEVLNYHNYVNTARVEALNRDITFEDFRNLGINVNDQGEVVDQFITDPKTGKKHQILNRADNILKGQIIRAKEEGVDVNTRLKELWLNTKNAIDLGRYGDLAGTFAYQQTESDYLKTVEYEKKLKEFDRQEKYKIAFAAQDVTSIFGKQYNIKEQKEYLKNQRIELNKKRNDPKSSPDEIAQLEQDLAQEEYLANTVINKQFDNPLIRTSLQTKYNEILNHFGSKKGREFLSKIGLDDSSNGFDLFVKMMKNEAFTPIVNDPNRYDTQFSEELSLLLDRSKNGGMLGRIGISNKGIMNEIQEIIKENGITGMYSTVLNLGTDNFEQHPLHQYMGTKLVERANATTILGDVTEDGHKVLLSDELAAKGYNSYNYNIYAAPITSNSSFRNAYKLYISPKNKDAANQETIEYDVQLNPSIGDQVTEEIDSKIFENTDGTNSTVNDYILNNTAYRNYGVQFNKLMLAEEQGVNIKEGQLINNVTIRDAKGNKGLSNLKVREYNLPNSKQVVIGAFVVDNNGVEIGSQPYAFGTNIPSLIKHLANQTFFTK